MSTKRDNNIDGVLPLSYRGRAEAFARHLHCRLRSLGHDSSPTTTDPITNGLDNHDHDSDNLDSIDWISAPQKPINSTDNTTTLPTTNGENGDHYISEYLLDATPGSPDEEISELDLHRMITNATDNLASPSTCESCWCLKNNKYASLNPESETENTTVTAPLAFNFTDNASETSDSSDYYDPENIDIMDNVDGDDAQPETTIYMNGVGLSHIRVNHCLSSENPELLNETNTNETEKYCSTININKELVVDCLAEEIVDNPVQEVVDSASQTEGEVSVVLVEQKQEEESTKSESEITAATKVMPEDDEEPDDEEKIPRVRRCSSLKTGKTPPGTPGQKKIVRFADVLGLDLTDVRTYLDEIPKVPTSAYVDLNEADLILTSTIDSSLDSQLPCRYLAQKADKILVPLFQQPGGLTNFLDIVRERNCCLENACVQDTITLSISGTVRVLNLDFHKSVHIRYTLDAWNSYADLQATYVQNSCDGFSDKFSFLIYCHTLEVGQRVEFAVRFQTKGTQFWDNNLGVNYCFQCLPSSTNAPILPITCPEDWGCNSFY